MFYINDEFYTNFINETDIDINKVDIIDVDPDGNRYMRCIALFVYKKEDEHIRVRNEISNYLSLHINEFENISIPTEVGMKSVYEYR